MTAFCAIDFGTSNSAIALPVGQTGSNQPPGAAVGGRFAVFDHPAINRGVFDHVGKVDFIHSRHPAIGMPQREVSAQQLVLLIG